MTRLVLAALVVAWVTPGELRDAARGQAIATVPVIVEGADEGSLSALRAGDFEVSVNGQPAGVHSVTRELASGTLLLLIDVSWSSTFGGRVGSAVLGHDFAGLVRGIEEGLVGRLMPGERLAVGRFAGRQFTIGEGFLTERGAQIRAVRALLEPVAPVHRFGPSPVWDMAASASARLVGQPGPRALILVTDGHSTGNHLRMAEAAARVAALGVAIHVLFQPEWAGSGIVKYERGDVLLRSLSQLTGGLFRIDDSVARFGWQDPLPPFDELLEGIRRTLWIRVAFADAATGLHQVDVRATRPGLTVHSPRWVQVGEPQR